MHNCDTIQKEMFITKMQQSNVIYMFIHHEGSIKQRRKKTKYREDSDRPYWSWKYCISKLV